MNSQMSSVPAANEASTCERPWTRDEWMLVLRKASSSALDKAARAIGRSIEDIEAKARAEGVNLFQGSWTVEEVAELTGHSVDAVRRACAAADVRSRRYDASQRESATNPLRIFERDLVRVAEQLARAVRPL